VYLILEYAEGGELFNRIKNGVSETEAQRLFNQLLTAVNYLHNNSIVHRDLKPENILLDSKGNIKISDFGLARFDATHMQSLCGTPHYVAPEVIRLGLGNSNTTGYSKAVDMWSLGVSLYHMLTGQLPFTETDRMALFRLIEKGQYEFPSNIMGDISSHAKDLIKKLLDVIPTTRLTADQALKHHWFVINQKTNNPTTIPSKNPINLPASNPTRALQALQANRKRTSEMVICSSTDITSKSQQAQAETRKKFKNNRKSTVL